MAFATTLVVIALLAAGQSKPNFTGKWKLNLQKSGPVMPLGLTALTLVIRHVDTQMTTTETRVTSGKTTEGTSKKLLDGVEHTSHPKPESTIRERQTWQGDNLISHWEMTNHATVYTSDIRTTLSSDRTIMTMHEDYREPGMKRIRDWIFEKQ